MIIKLKSVNKQDIIPSRTLKLIDLGDALDPAKEMIKELSAIGIKNPRVKIIDMQYNEVWTILSKKDVAEKFYKAATLTAKEQEALTMLMKAYETSGINNCDFDNVFGYNNVSFKGVIGSLVRKQVLDHYNCPDCFNPIYPSHNLISTCEKYGIKVCQEVEYYLK